MKTILIVDDHILFREGMRNIISNWDDYKVVGEGSNGLEAVNLARELFPDIILMDISMPIMNGIEATKQIASELPMTYIVILTMSEEREDLFNAIKYGAQGYILKDTPSRRLHNELRKMLQGEAPLSGLMANKMLDEFSHSGSPTPPSPNFQVPLTEREHQVLELVVEGLSNTEIAKRIYLSENTIKKYLKNIMIKLHLNNRVEAAVYAVRQNLVD